MGVLGTFFKRLFHPTEGPMLKQGDAAPAFEVDDHEGRPVKLADFRGRRVVLWFYPKADTPG
jgi:peroxiredoxin Q/BCP